MQQRSLFPDEFELQQAAMRLLQQFRPHEAQSMLERALQVEAKLPNQQAMLAAIQWFAARLAPTVAPTGGPPDVPVLLDWFAAATAAQFHGQLDANTGELVERVLARALLAVVPEHAVFADAAGRTPVALLRQCAGGAAMLPDRLALADALATPALAERADLWAYHGDICWSQQRQEEANSSYLRALLLGASEVDLVHLRHPGLRELGRRLQAELGEQFASHWFIEAVLAGLLQVPPQNAWLRREQVDLLLELASDAWSRFGILWYRDLAMGEAGDIVTRRMELAELLPEVFARVMAWRLGGGPAPR